MRIIAGKARGRKLIPPATMETRPTLDRVKEAMFSTIQNYLLDAVVIDVFAGTGSLGLEAASRGAKKVYMCEKSKDAIQIIQKNIEKTHLKEQVILYEGDYEKTLENRIKEKPDIVYIDPPYKTDYAIKAIKILQQKALLKSTTTIIIETDREEIIKELEKLKNIIITDIRKYGRASIVFTKITNS